MNRKGKVKPEIKEKEALKMDEFSFVLKAGSVDYFKIENFKTLLNQEEIKAISNS